ncbi:hypothetical protein DQ04_00291090 [Trypanosoma grayi]|uniref:hypothetical protein n=1 Tax=Trypanosoma grayi TaxID=71804 RepID=UPI0004F4AFF1|nr:hypothetical protein DQ04_00291090 [Trypanosoma grayi]KEG14823.1 hypothetical protein DQ04_00291090 [Trypanosoma grayi]
MTQAEAVSNSFSAHVYHDSLLLFSGLFTDRLWWLNLSSFVWNEGPCTGVFPPPTRFHATALCGSRLYVCGGESPRLDASCIAPASLQHDLLDLFVVDLAELRWERVLCAWKPRVRSHHTMTAVSDSALIVMGGKPRRDEVTSYEMREMMAGGFYAVLVFDVTAGLWRTFSQTLFPCLWGHSAHVVNDDAIVIFGGFETTLEVSEHGEQIPAVAVNNYMWFLNWRTMECYRAGSRVPGRVLHQSHICGDKLHVLGGISVDEACLDLVLQQDAMAISLTSFETRPMKFCLQHWPLELMASVVYNQQLIVLNKMEDFFVLRAIDDDDWERYRCDTTNIITSPFSAVRAIKYHADAKGREEHGSVLTLPIDGPPSKPSLSPLMWELLAQLEYPLADLR